MNLYRKYQPKEWGGVLGNETEIKALQQNLAREGGPHCFIIHGEAGCGKGTIARIAARELGGTNLSITEVNTADYRGIESVRDAITKMQFKQGDGAPRVLIIDEAHGLTTDAKRAWLKPLEDTPEHVYIFFLTTHVKKLFAGDEGKALKTRLTPVRVSPVDSNIIFKHLRKIVKKEGALDHVSSEICREIADNCEGSPRQAIVWLDGIIEIEDPAEQEKKLARDMEGGDNDPDIFKFCKTLWGAKSWKPVGAALKALKGQKDVEAIRQSAMGYMSAIVLNSGSGRAAWMLSCLCDYQYSNGWPGLVSSCYEAFAGDEDE